MRIVCISDTHNYHNQMEHPIPKGDVLIHAGDISGVGEMYEVTKFVNWFKNIEGFEYKIFIAGNHDLSFERINQPHRRGNYDWLSNLISDPYLPHSSVYYLEDSSLVIETTEFSKPIKFYGTPWQPEFFNWAFNLPRDGEELYQKWQMIPDDTNVLITHGPPYNVRDYVPDGDSVGCRLLRDRIEVIKPQLNVFGHIHHAHGMSLVGDTMYVNASICTERYKPTNKPIVVDLKEIDGQILAYPVDESN
jgi:Icc-related predicted phosphoesterase